jgi:DUF1680 family protein
MATRDGGLAALVLGPCEVTGSVQGGVEVTVAEDTSYPFEPEVRFTLRTATAVEFPLSVRIPGWATAHRLEVNGEAVEPEEQPAAQPSLRTVVRTWHDGDTIRLELPMSPRLSRWERGSIGVECGPLVYCLPIGEEWRKVGGSEPFADYELHPTTAWNYGLVADPSAPGESLTVERRETKAQPWTQENAPVRVRARARRISSWTPAGGVSALIPESPATADGRIEEVSLVPFGCARLRISMFPRVAAWGL